MGPPLWNTHYADSATPIASAAFEELVYADGLSAFRSFPASTSDGVLLEGMEQCLKNLHDWGRANGVRFDASKESMHIVSRVHTRGDLFAILGVYFDTKLVVDAAVQKCAVQAGWRLRTLLRTQRFHAYRDDSSIS